MLTVPQRRHSHTLGDSADVSLPVSLVLTTRPQYLFHALRAFTVNILCILTTQCTPTATPFQPPYPHTISQLT